MASLVRNLSGKRVVVLGLGASGIGAAKLASAMGATVVATDSAKEEKLSQEARALGDVARVSLVAGGHEGVPFDSSDLVVVSPGVPALEVVLAAERAGVEVIGELEFAWRTLSDVSTIAIGGTNGKSTTTTLVGEMALAEGRAAFVGGNLGTPLSEIAVATLADPRAKPDLLVLEVSSFQAERVPTFRPHAATILNITPDHLDRYPNSDTYADAKGNMLVAMLPSDTVVIPFGDPATAKQAARSKARVVTFGPGGDVFATKTTIEDRVGGRSYDRSQIKLRGEHNARNVEASIALATAAGIADAAIRKALSTFEGLAHRIAFVAEIDGVSFYDDSKGTNVGASVAALRGLSEQRAVLIAGGKDKLGAYDPLVDALRDRGRAAVLIGEAAARIEEAIGDAVPVKRASSMEEAVSLSLSLASPGDAVLLSPACSSFDMFRDYKHRGDAFVSAVRELSAKRGGR